MDADKVLEDPAGRGVLDGWPVLVGEGRLGVLERFSDALLHGGRHQPADGHDQPQRQAPLGFLEIERSSQKAGIFEKPKTVFHMLLAFIAVQQLLGW